MVMTVLVIGAKGFIGSNVAKRLSQDLEVVSGDRQNDGTGEEVFVDLTDKQSILAALNQVQPEVVVNCAGIVENNEKAALNPGMTQNLLEVITESGIQLHRIVVLGSAAEYGIVEQLEGAIAEETPLLATSPYGISKVDEGKIVEKFRVENNLPIIVARLFNPIGNGMPERMLIPRIFSQLQEVQAGEKSGIEISRLDSYRDYIDVRDVAEAIYKIVTGEPKHVIYNVGSGARTSNGELIGAVLRAKGTDVPVLETSTEPEPNFAAQADISKLTNDFGWKPVYTIDDVVKELTNV